MSTEHLRQYTAELGLAEEEAPRRGLEKKVEGVRGMGRGGSREGVARMPIELQEMA